MRGHIGYSKSGDSNLFLTALSGIESEVEDIVKRCFDKHTSIKIRRRYGRLKELELNLVAEICKGLMKSG